MSNPPLAFPSDIEFPEVPTPSFTEATGGRLFNFKGDVVVHIDGDSSAVFSVSSVETLALRPDPEAPPGTPAVWTTIATVDGPGPINTKVAGALAITVGLALPANTQQTAFSATAVVVPQGTSSPVLMQMPINAIVDLVGDLKILVVNPPILQQELSSERQGNLVF